MIWVSYGRQQMKKLFLTFIPIITLLSSCYTPVDRFVRGYNYEMFMKDPKYSFYSNFAESLSLNNGKKWLGAGYTQESANQMALATCNREAGDCIIRMENRTNVYAKNMAIRDRKKQDVKMNEYVASCEKIGFKRVKDMCGINY